MLETNTFTVFKDGTHRPSASCNEIRKLPSGIEHKSQYNIPFARIIE